MHRVLIGLILSLSVLGCDSRCDPDDLTYALKMMTFELQDSSTSWQINIELANDSDAVFGPDDYLVDCKWLVEYSDPDTNTYDEVIATFQPDDVVCVYGTCGIGPNSAVEIQLTHAHESNERYTSIECLITWEEGELFKRVEVEE